MIHSQGQHDVISSAPNGDVLMPKRQTTSHQYPDEKA